MVNANLEPVQPMVFKTMRLVSTEFCFFFAKIQTGYNFIYTYSHSYSYGLAVHIGIASMLIEKQIALTGTAAA